MKVLLVCHYVLPHVGGIEVLVEKEARLLAEAGHEVVILASDAGEGEPPARPAGVRICRVVAWNGLEQRFHVPWPVFSPSLVPRLWTQVRWCDVVHAQGFLYLDSFLSLVFARLLRKKTMLTEHIGLAWYEAWPKRVLQRLAVELLGRASVRLAARSRGYHPRVVELLRSLAGPRGNVRYIPNPLDRTLFRPPSAAERTEARERLGWNDGRPRVLFVGRLIWRKGIDLVLEAGDPAYELVFCGPADPKLVEAVRRSGCEYLPPRPQPDLVGLYHAADALVLPSRAEGGLALVAQEALACGLPAVVGEDPGLARYEGCEGLTFCDLTPEAIRETLLRVLEERRTGISAAENRVALDSYLPDERWWLEQLYG